MAASATPPASTVVMCLSSGPTPNAAVTRGKGHFAPQLHAILFDRNLRILQPITPGLPPDISLHGPQDAVGEAKRVRPAARHEHGEVGGQSVGNRVGGKVGQTGTIAGYCPAKTRSPGILIYNKGIFPIRVGSNPDV